MGKGLKGKLQMVLHYHMYELDMYELDVLISTIMQLYIMTCTLSNCRPLKVPNKNFD